MSRLAASGFGAPTRVRPRRAAQNDARRVWLSMIAAAREIAGEIAAGWPDDAIAERLRVFGREARTEAAQAAFPVEGLSARLAADGFLTMARALAEAQLPARRGTLSAALLAIAEALAAMLDEQAIATAQVWRRRFGDDD